MGGPHFVSICPFMPKVGRNASYQPHWTPNYPTGKRGKCGKRGIFGKCVNLPPDEPLQD